MALTVSSSLNQKTWDATVRVTGGHPHQLWGIGAVQQSAEGAQLTVDRVLIRDADERMVGYAQLLMRQENGSTHAEAHQAHVNNPTMVPAFMQKLGDYVRDRYDGESITVSVDTPAAEPLAKALIQRGWSRQGALEAESAGPKRLRVPLGVADTALSSRLSPSTLDRCRAGLKVSNVAVREITANSGGVRAVGLKTGQINHLLKDLGQDSLLLVAAQERPDEQPEALGYLWFVHTVNMAMLYRVGFTRKARDLGIDDALLLTGTVELQKRGVQRMDGGESSDKDVPTVVRELADRERTVLGTWRKDLTPVQDAEVPPAQPEPERRGLFGRKKHAPEQAPEPQKQPEPPKRVDEVRQQVSKDLGIETTGITPAQSHLELGGGQVGSVQPGNSVPGDNHDTSVAQDSEPGTNSTPVPTVAHPDSANEQTAASPTPGAPTSRDAAEPAAGGLTDGNTATNAESTTEKPRTKVSKRAARKQRRASKRAVTALGAEAAAAEDVSHEGRVAQAPVAESSAQPGHLATFLADEDSPETVADHAASDGAAPPSPAEADTGQKSTQEDSTDEAPVIQTPTGKPDRHPEPDPNADSQPKSASTAGDRQTAARADDHVEGDASRRTRGPLAFGKRVYAESFQAFRDAAGR